MKKMLLFFLFWAVFAPSAAYGEKYFQIIEGDEVAKIFDSFSQLSKDIQRGEFEKKQDYDARMGDLTKGISPLSAHIDTHLNNIHYDIDNEVFTVSPFAFTRHYITSRLCEFKIYEKIIIYDEARNILPFDEKYKAKEVVVSNYYIVTVNLSDKDKIIKEHKLNLKLRCKPEIAKEIKSKIGVVVDFIPTKHNPHNNKGERVFSEHSRDRQKSYRFFVDEDVREYALFVKLLNVRIVNKENGETLRTYRFK